MATVNFNVYIESSIVGSKLSISVKKKKAFSRWSVEDKFNGLTRDVAINESIYGFYRSGDVVDLHVYDKDNVKTTIKNVTIIEKKKEVTLNV